MNEKQAQFIPFHAINEFLLPDYRIKLIQLVLSSDKVSPQHLSTLNRIIKNSVKVPGFRNSAQAPAPVKAKAAVSAFERNPEFVAHAIAGWFEVHPEMAQRAYDLLTARGWELLPLDADRTKLPGFLTRWPKKDSFEVLDDAYEAAYPGSGDHEYDINMMFVWLSGRLPYELVGEDGEVEEMDEEETED